ncbi:hypothetical protein Ahy_B10g106077 [Arachis hypogaea]|uniref:PB1-like domain-containing protein n=1 Tax=Arachis hypogaea TaxID=3818 RepID=A0A444X9N4_ARAHY|nr:hypothetical protein Ahy_B10g106077 [Arachis hypogaea]
MKLVNQRMDEVLDIMFHHGGTFEKGVDGKIGYYPDNRNCLGDVEVDRLDVFYLRNYYKELDYDKMKEVWWLVPGKSIREGLRKLNSDADLREMCEMGSHNENLVDIYIEREVSSPKLIQGKEVMIYVDDRVRDFGMQAKENAAAAPHNGASPNDEKNPTDNVSRPREQGVKASVKVPIEQKLKKKAKNTPKPTQTKVNRRYCLRSVTGIRGIKGQKRGQGSKMPVMLLSSDEDSSNSDESLEDEPYKPVREDSSSDSYAVDPVPSRKVKGQKKTANNSNSQYKGKGKNKGKEKIRVDDDAFVEDVSDVEVDLGFVGADDHTCAREDKNRAVNRNWVASKLVKKVSKYPNFRHCDANTFKTKILCVHTCAAIARVNKHPEDFCHKLLTMESYNATYCHHINPLPGQQLWERSENNRPLAPLALLLFALQEHQLKRKTPTRPGKLPLRRRSPPPIGSASSNPMQGASDTTATRLANFLKFVPTPGFKPLRKK